MSLHRCPRDDPNRRMMPPVEVACSKCGVEVELWENEEQRVCSDCGQVVHRTDEAGGTEGAGRAGVGE